jgi:hypothetical protein
MKEGFQELQEILPDLFINGRDADHHLSQKQEEIVP